MESAQNPIHNDGDVAPVKKESNSTERFEVSSRPSESSTQVGSCCPPHTPPNYLGTWPVIGLLAFNSFFMTVMLSLFWTAGVFYYIPILKMSLVWNSAAGTLSSLVSIYTGIYIAYYGDRVKTRWGKRKPLLLLFYPFIALPVIGIYFCPFTDVSGVEGWYLICLLLMAFGSTCYNTVFSAWFIESSYDAADYLRISVFGCSIPSAIGGIIGLAMSKMGILTIPSVVAAVFGAISLLLLIYYVPNRIIMKSDQQPPLLSSFRVLSRTQEYKTILINRIVLQSSWNICGEFLLYTSFMCFPGIKHFKQIQTLYIIFAVSVTIVGIPVTIILQSMIAAKWEKIKIYMNMTLALVALSGALFLLYLPGLIAENTISAEASEGLMWFWMTLIIMGSFIFSGALFLEQLIVRDVIRFDTYRTGLNRENMYQSALTVPGQVVSNVIVAIPLAIFTASGFQQIPDPPMNDDLMAHRYIWNTGSHVQLALYSSILFGAGAYLSYHWFNRFPLLQSVADKIENALRTRMLNKEKAGLASFDSKSKVTPATNPVGEKGGGGDAVVDAKMSNANSSFSEEGVPGDLRKHLERANSINDGLGSIADNADEMLFNHFSAAEILAMSKCDPNERSNSALNRIILHHRLNLWLIAPGTMASIIAGMVRQMIVSSQYQVVVVNIFCISSFFLLYEALRFQPISALIKMKSSDVQTKALESYKSLTTYQESLKEMLERSGIEADDASGTRESLAAPVIESESTDDKDKSKGKGVGDIDRGYLRLYFLQSALLCFGLAFAIVNPR